MIETWAELPPLFGPGVFARATSDLALSPLSPRPAGPPAAAGSGAVSPKRLREFAAGRRCAAQALRDAGAREVAVGVGPAREPIWPAGFVGSISHSAQMAGAAVASTSVARSLGLDFEPVFDESAMREVAPLALSAEEERFRSELPPRALAATIFSGKESLFKCLYPLARTFFEFHDARVVALDAAGVFRIRLVRSLGGEFVSGSVFEGRFAIEGPLVYTAIVLPR